jgi:hypothetical protein
MGLTRGSLACAMPAVANNVDGAWSPVKPWPGTTTFSSVPKSLLYTN